MAAFEWLENEKRFYDPSSSKSVKFPSPFSQPTIDLSVIIPAYNEELRLPSMLDEALSHLENRCKENSSFTYEVIIVDDGSSDSTSDLALKYSADYGSNKVRLLKLDHNRGKGGAVRLGMLCSRGHELLMADGDGATKFSDYDKLHENLCQLSSTDSNESVLVIGSRAHLQDDAVAKRSFFRNLLMYFFHLLVALMCRSTIQDTQCGFKLFSRAAMLCVFTNLHVERWAFDVEVIYIAGHFNVSMKEVPVNWTEIPGSKIVPVFSWMQMAKDLIMIRLKYTLGIWTINRNYLKSE